MDARLAFGKPVGSFDDAPSVSSEPSRNRACDVVALRRGRRPVARDYWRERSRQLAQARLRLLGVGFIGADKTLDAFVSARSRSPVGIDLADAGDGNFRPCLGLIQTDGLSGLWLD